MNDFLNQLSYDKMKINWNRNPIKMDLFLSFLTVEVKRNKGFLGEDTGWTQLSGNDGLIIKGGILREGEFLDMLQYKMKLHNPYNNFVNPFYLFEILNQEGKDFFIEYYRNDIDSLLEKYEENLQRLKRQLELAVETKQECVNFMRNIGCSWVGVQS